MFTRLPIKKTVKNSEKGIVWPFKNGVSEKCSLSMSIAETIQKFGLRNSRWKTTDLSLALLYVFLS